MAAAPTPLQRARSWPFLVRAVLWIALSVGAFFTLNLRLMVWLSIGTITEAYPWLLWGETYLELARNLYTIARPVLLTAVTVCTTWGLWRLLFPPVPRPRALPLRFLLWLPRLLFGALALAALAVLLIPLLVNSVRFTRTFPPRTDHVIQSNCGHCHSPYRPQHFVRTEAQWRRTVTRMIDRNGAPVNERQKEKVIAWLRDYRGFSDAWMFRAKCLRCHGKHHLVEQDRTAQEWAWIVDRMGWVSTFGYRHDQRDQIKAHLAAELAVPDPQPGDAEYTAWKQRVDLMNACNPCHSLSLVLEEGALDDPKAMLERMSYKDPVLVPPERIDELVEALETLPKDAEGFWDLFPHDVLLDVK